MAATRLGYFEIFVSTNFRPNKRNDCYFSGETNEILAEKGGLRKVVYYATQEK